MIMTMLMIKAQPRDHINGRYTASRTQDHDGGVHLLKSGYIGLFAMIMLRTMTYSDSDCK